MATSLDAPCWLVKSEAKKASQLQAIPKEWRLPLDFDKDKTNVTDLPAKSDILSALDLQITEIDDVDQLLAHIREGIFSALEVTTAYLKRALLAHQLVSESGFRCATELTAQVNCLTEFWIDDALAQAVELDRVFQEGRLAGPLHGLPISLKDQWV